MWQGKDLRTHVFGSVAMIRLTGDFSEVWQTQELATFLSKVEVCEGGVRRTARRVRMGLSGAGLKKEPCPNREAYYTISLPCVKSPISRLDAGG